MTNRKKQTAVALAGAVALASGAYAIGTQTGDGSAVAAGDRTAAEAGDEAGRIKAGAIVIAGRGPGVDEVRFRGGPGPRLEGLADRLGVEEDALQDAMEDLRGDIEKPMRDDFAAELAGELKIDEARVEAALERLRAKTEDRMEAAHDEFVKKLADRLNLDVDKVEDALDDGPFGRHPARP